jgi:hypothetical protein
MCAMRCITTTTANATVAKHMPEGEGGGREGEWV